MAPSGTSDAKRSDASPPPVPYFDAGGRFLHFCQHPGCRAWGAHGRGCNLVRHGEAVAKGDAQAVRFLGVWYCDDHVCDHPPASELERRTQWHLMPPVRQRGLFE